jgi:hypothetical protein
MKNKSYTRLLSLAILSAMFIFIFSPKAEGSENQAGKNHKNGVTSHVETLAHPAASGTGTADNGSKRDRLDQDVKTARSVIEVDYWTWMKSQFIWNLAVKRPAPFTSAAGC